MDCWLKQLFVAGQVAKGNIVRRCISDVEKYSSMAALVAAVKMHGFHLAIIGDQAVVVCNSGGVISIVC